MTSAQAGCRFFEVIKWATIVYFRQMTVVDVYERGELEDEVRRISRHTEQGRIDSKGSIRLCTEIRNSHGDIPILHFDRGWCLKDD